MQTKPSLPLVRVLYNHNPFYLMSTCCVLYAIKRVFRPMEVPYIDPWMLMAALTGLTVFMAATAWVVVRFGKVWEDARSLMLVLVMMFLAMSVSFDEILNLRGTEAFWLLAAGLVVSVLMTECVVRLLRIPFPWLFRAPFYLMLALFFGYPMLVSPEVTDLGVIDTRARVLMFPFVAGLITLTLFPAVRRGRRLIDDCISPCQWTWPLLPWTLFGFLALAVCGRSYYLSISFDAASGHVTEMFTAFGAYALNPFFVCVSVLLLEIAIVQRSQRFQNRVVVLSSLIMLICSIPTPTADPTYRNFLNTLVQTAGSPVFLTGFGLFVYGTYAWFRGVRTGEYVVLASLSGLSVVGWRTLSLKTLTAPHPFVLGILVAVLLITGLKKRDAFRCFLAATAITAGMALALWNHEISLFYRVLPAHFFLLSTILIGAVFRGRMALFLHVAGALLLPTICLITGQAFYELGVHESLCAAYFTAMSTAAILYGVLIQSRLYQIAGGLTFTCGTALGIWIAAQRLSGLFGVELVVAAVSGLGCFLVAALITVHKARTLRTAPPG